MIRKLLPLVLVFISFQLFSQNPEKVYSIVRTDKDYTWYEQQAKAWRGELRKNKKDGQAWINFYTANRMAMLLNESKWRETTEDYFQPLDKIVEQAKHTIPNTFESYYLETYNDGDPSSKAHDVALMNAQKLRPFDSLLLSHLMNYYQLHRDARGIETISQVWFDRNEMPSGLLNTAYNQLMSVDEHAILFVNGDNDTYPNWILQSAKNIRKDVLILNVSLLLIDSYRDEIFKENQIPELKSDELNFDSSNLIAHVIKNIKNRPVYVSTFLDTDLYKSYADNMYLVGLAFKYSETNFNNLAVLQNNFENKFLVDYLKIDFSNQIGQSVVNKVKSGYIAMLLKLYENYKLCGEIYKAENTKKLAQSIATLNSDKDWMSYFGE